MCGVFGVISDSPIDAALLEAAQTIQAHRGPDAQSVQRLTVGRCHVGLAHQRLAIIDLTAAGAQPMHSPSGRSLIAYNGEVYNYLELRAELEKHGVTFRTRTDTEVIAAACEHYGIDEALRRMNGMWAFVWVDLERSRIYIARDRFGVKPLYLYARNGLLAFASEIKTLVRALRLRCAVNVGAVSTFLRASLVDTNDATFFEGIAKLTPGHYAQLDAGRGALAWQTTRYWALTGAVAEIAPMSDVAAAEAVRSLLEDAVRLRLRSDVPVGLLLSGGLDSSAIAAVAGAQLVADDNLTFISAVSDDAATDESRFIRIVARHLGRPVQEVRLEFPRDRIVPLIARVTEQCDEPLGGFACVAQNLLMQRAHELGVKVLLSGQGADEVFCGYRKYALFQLQALVRGGQWTRALCLLMDFARERTVLSQLNLTDARRYLPRWLRFSGPDLAGPALESVPLADLPLLGSHADIRDRQRLDIESLSIPALTHWEDRNSMAWSREVRNPFLDFRLVSLGVSLPMRMKVAHGWTKHVLRQALVGRLPESILWRRDKRGFSTPEARLLRNELRGHVDELLDSEAEIVRRGLVNLRAARARFAAFLRDESTLGQGVASREIFQLISLEMWLRSFRESLSG
jgi:asparagine synthase (glutamine-hydrolysing)